MKAQYVMPFLLLALSPQAAWSGGGPDMIPDGVPGGSVIPTNGATSITPSASGGLIQRTRFQCDNNNLRTRTNAWSASASATETFTINTNLSGPAATLTISFPPTAFFSTTAGAAVSGNITPVTPGVSEPVSFDQTNRMVTMNWDVDVPAAVINGDGTMVKPIPEIQVNSFSLTQQGTSNPNCNNFKSNAQACDGPLSVYNYFSQPNFPTQLLSQFNAGYSSTNGKPYIDSIVYVPVDLNQMVYNAVGANACTNKGLYGTSCATGTTNYCQGWRSPLYLFFDEKRPQFTGVSNFPLDPWGRPVRWVEPNAPGYLLVLDRNRDGKITEAFELFGDSAASNGFEELKKFDANRDGKIDNADPVFSNLQLWRDVDGDGKSARGELFTLKKKQVVSVDLRYKENEVTPLPSGVEFRESSTFKFVDARGDIRTGAVIDVWLGTTYDLPKMQEVAPVAALQPFGSLFMNLPVRGKPLSTVQTGM